jgi:rRNA-processing protein FCF1
MRRILLDTSSIVFAFSNKLDIFALVEERLDSRAVVSDGILAELKKLSLRRNKEGNGARLALQVMQGHKVEALKNSQKVDDFLVKAGTEGEMLVCTNDIGVKRRLKSRGIRPLSVSRSGVLR